MLCDVMFKFLQRDPVKALQKKYEALTTQAFHSQRNGDIRGYSLLTEQAQVVLSEIEQRKSK